MLSLGLTVGVLALIVWWKEIRLGDLQRHWQGADKLLLALAFAVSALFHVLLGAHKLWLVLRTLKVDVSYRDVVRVVLGMGPLQVILPLKGGEIVAILFFWRHKRMPLGNASGAIVFDRSLNFVAAGAWMLVGLLLDPGGDAPYSAGLLGASAVLVVLLFAPPVHDLGIRVARALHPRLERLARGVLEPWRAMPARRKLLFLGYGMLVVVRPILVCYLVFRAYHQSPPLSQVLVYTAVAIFAGHLPGPLMGMGPREGAIVGMAHRAGLGGGAVALSVGLLLSLLVYIGPMLLGLPWVPWLMHRLAAGQGARRQTAPLAEEIEPNVESR